ncbi:MAG: c-type cytochrome [Ignavibacteria bacterium]|nr:c-type cytochrome [Ignavibacteria bacterium]
MKRILLLGIVAFLALVAFRSDENFSVPTGWPNPHYDFSKNPPSRAKIELGRALFYDPILSRNSTISCASCHSQYTAFTHVDHALSHGIDDRIGTRNSPALMNLAWSKDFMWDGAVNHLDMQALAPISNPQEMDETMTHVVHKLSQTSLYPPLFRAAYGDSTITGERLLKAMSQFMLTLISARSKYDSVMQREAEFTLQEQNGYRLFQTKCSSCHTEPLFTNYQFENNGLPLDTTLMDYGRMSVTKQASDSLKFKVPTLRNIEFSYPYMHDGRFKRLRDVLMHYSTIRQNGTESNKLQPMNFTSNEMVDLTAFLLTLTDRKFLFDTAYSYPKYIFATQAKD